MNKRRFGRTGHMSTVAIFGAASLWEVTQEEADRAMAKVLAAGVNHIDVAPSYGVAEERLGPWLAREDNPFFVGCKTMERTKEGAADELRRSLRRLQIEAFDLYQLHAVTSIVDLDQITAPGGALEALVEARAAGLLQYIGITSHGMDAPSILLDALRRFRFDSVLVPVNFVLYGDPAYSGAAQRLLQKCCEEDVGIMAIKAVAKGPWGDRPRAYTTWYEPFDQAGQIQQAVDFALSQGVTGLCTVGDLTLLPLFLAACDGHRPMNAGQQRELIAEGREYHPIFA